MNFTARIALVAALALCAFPARADWTGTLHIHTDPATGKPSDLEQTGLISAKGTRMRMELSRPETGKMVVVADMKGETSLIIFDDKHAYMHMDNEKLRQRGTSIGGMRCESDDEATCLKVNGFAKTGSEVANGRKSDRWEKDRTDHNGAKLHMTLWVPQGVKGFSMIKQTSTWPDHTLTMDVLDFKEGAVADAQFEPPAGYTDMGSHFGMGGVVAGSMSNAGVKNPPAAADPAPAGK